MEKVITRSIPYLKFDFLAIHIDSPDFEVNTYGGDKRWCKLVFAESQ
jgi:hypothetical protein